MDLITYDNAHKVKNILLNGNLDNKSINLEFKYINAKVNINGLTEVEKSEIFIDENMEMFWFINSLNEEDTYLCIDILHIPYTKVVYMLVRIKKRIKFTIW